MSWQRLSRNSGSSTEPYVTASGSNVYVAWSDDTPGNPEIFIRRFSDSGNTWSWKRMSNNSGLSYATSIAASGSKVYVAWMDTTPTTTRYS